MVTTKKPDAKRKRQKVRQRAVKRGQKRREDAQLSGSIPTSSAGAVKSEVVNPSSQGEQPLPQLIGRAIRSGWATPEELKPVLVQELVGIVLDPEVKGVTKTMAYQALLKGDQQQYERDHPEEAAKAKGQVNQSVTVAVGYVDPYAAWRKAEAEAAVDGVEQRLSEEAGNVDGSGGESEVRDVLRNDDEVEQGGQRE